VSQSLTADDLRVEVAVRQRSQWATALHRPDPEADEPRPACQQARARSGEFREVRPGTHPTYDLCQNPACFGDDHRRGGHMWPGLLTDRPIRIQTYHTAVVVAAEGDTPVSVADIEGVLAVGERHRSARRGIRDAVDAGWLEPATDHGGSVYQQGPLARALGRKSIEGSREQ